MIQTTNSNNHRQPILLSGNSNKSLATAIVNILQIPLGKSIINKFSDGEIKIQILDNLYNKDVFILQSTCPPVNDHLLELFLLANAAHKAKATSITAIIPYFGYARQTRIKTTESNSAQLIVKLLETSHINKIITMDIHIETICQFFNIPCINLYNTKIIIRDLNLKQLKKLTIVSPDLGSLIRAKHVITHLSDPEFAIIYKKRTSTNKIINTNIVGQIKTRNCIIIDDIIDTATTICTAAETLKKHGAQQIIAYCTHPVLSGKAIQNIKNSLLTEVIVTNTIPLSLASKKCKKIRQLSVVEIIADYIQKYL